MLEMIQQKSVYRSNSGTLTGGLTAFSRRPVLAEFRCVRGDARVAVQKTKETCESVATQWSWRSYREQRSRRGRVPHSDVGDSSVSRCGRVFREKDRPYVQSASGLTSFSRKDNGEFGTSRKLVGTSLTLVGGEWKIHYVRRTRDVAGRNRKHQDRVKRKGTR